ncbi:HAD family hydrolase [Rhodococcus rhodnii]|uniref:HAD family hydrolase n=1 Tax=Rhodococcus rhodnii TaxID=38312 RepID=A0A6P2CHN3_9NOCA|nr:HAD family hydrolase [Rhodococcus rhodnii]
MGRGLSTDEARRRLERDGRNELPQSTPKPPWRLLLAQMTHLFAGMLWVAALLALLARMPVLAAAIAVIVVLNGVFAFLQEYRADQAAQKLRSLMPATARVRRDGAVTTVDAAELVPGDVVLLSAGDRIGADLTLADVDGLGIDASVLTGESVPEHPGRGDTVHSGTYAVEGDAVGVVSATGSHTSFANIASLTEHASRPQSPLTVQLHRLVRSIAVLALCIGVGLAAVALLLGTSVTQALVFGIGVTVALVPEGLLPTVTLSLAHGAQRMASRHALVRRLEAVETLGATTFVCTDKTGTLTRNQMAVSQAWTTAGPVTVEGDGYDHAGTVHGDPDAVSVLAAAATGAAACVVGRAVHHGDSWIAEGDPLDAALDALAWRAGVGNPSVDARLPFTRKTMSSAAAVDGVGYLLGAPEAVLARCTRGLDGSHAELDTLASQGQRVMAVARRPLTADPSTQTLQDTVSGDMELLALLAVADPPREGVAEAIEVCRDADIRIAMVTGDSTRTGEAVARKIGLLGDKGVVVDSSDLPKDDAALANLLDSPDGAVIGRVQPADKLRIARAMRSHGHVVAMTGDGVNDAAALREADVGVAMGKSGSDVARSAADLVLLDDHFATIVDAIELGRSTFANIRRFLTYHLTDNVAELVPFVAWALSAGSLPLALGVLQVLALDIGTDMLPALALGDEPPDKRTMRGRSRLRAIVDGRLLRRALLVLGPTEAAVSMVAFVVVLLLGGWRWGESADPVVLATASGSAFAVIVLGQMANAFACRSEEDPVWRTALTGNRPLLAAIAVECVFLTVILGVPWLADLFGGRWPSWEGWLFAVFAVPAVILVDAAYKARRRARAEHEYAAGTR